MANVNKVHLIGRLTRDPDLKHTQLGSSLVCFGFAVTNRRKNSQTGEWEDDPMFIECVIFQRGESTALVDLIMQKTAKGSQLYLEGKLVLETWVDQTTGQNRSKHKIIVEAVQLLDARKDDGQQQPGRQANRQGASLPPPDENWESDFAGDIPSGKIPF